MARKDEKARTLLGPLEAEAMNVLWKASAPLTVRELLGELNTSRRSAPAYRTVMTVMNRLAHKGRVAP